MGDDQGVRVRIGHLPRNLRRKVATDPESELRRTPEEEAARAQHKDRLAHLEEDMLGYLRLGVTMVVDTAAGSTKVHWGMLTYHREGKRAEWAAASVEKTWGLRQGTVGIFQPSGLRRRKTIVIF